MCARISTVIFFFVVVSHSATVSATNATEVGTQPVDVLSPKALERVSQYVTSIRFWDTNNEAMRKAIVNELASDKDEISKMPGCPRIRFPLICDDEGTILENSCYFRMKRREKPGLLPIMIFTTTSIDEARSMCEKEIKSIKENL